MPVYFYRHLSCLQPAQSNAVIDGRSIDGFVELSKANQKIVIDRFNALRALSVAEEEELERQKTQLQALREAEDARRRNDIITTSSLHRQQQQQSNDDLLNNDSMQLDDDNDNNDNSKTVALTLSGPPLTPIVDVATTKVNNSTVGVSNKENSTFISKVENILLRNQGTGNEMKSFKLQCNVTGNLDFLMIFSFATNSEKCVCLLQSKSAQRCE